ncbi:MAG TPA: hypothetical protein VIK72_19205 [Clostridiaceae bacterium]
MSYSKTNWVDGTTDVNAINMNKIENQLESNTSDLAKKVTYFMPENYGASSTYSAGVDDTSFVQQAIDGAVAIGGEVRLTRMYYIPSGGLMVNGTLKISGVGGRLISTNQGGTFPGIAISGFRCSSATADCLTTNSAGTILVDFAVINTFIGNPTAGTGIKMNSGHNHALSRVTVQGFFNDIQVEGRFGTIDSCHFYDPVNYGMYFLNDNAGEGDFGDQGICNCVVAMLGRKTNAISAVRWESGGGIRWSNNKIVAGTGPGASGIGAFNYGLDIMVADGCTTVEFMVIGGGISSCSVAPVRIGQKGSSLLSGMYDLTFNGVVFQGSGTSAVAMLIGSADTTHADNIGNVYIGGCTFKGVPSGGIVAYNMHNLVVGTNIWQKAVYTGALVTLAGGNDTGVGTQGVNIAKQNIGSMTSVDLVRDNRKLSSWPSQSGEVDHGFTTPFYANVVGTWVTLGYFDLLANEGGAFMIDIEFSGYDYSFGAMYARYKRVISRVGNTSGIVTVAVLGTDEVGGTGTRYAVQFVTTTNNRVIIQYQLTTSGVTVWGRAKVQASGQIALSHVGV